MHVIKFTSILLFYLLVIAESRKTKDKTKRNSADYYVEASKEDFLSDLAEGNLKPPFEQTLVNGENCGKNLKYDFQKYPAFECPQAERKSNCTSNDNDGNDDDDDSNNNVHKQKERKKTIYRAHILHGYNIRLGEFPMFATLIGRDTNSTLRCSGTLISDNVIITAGHCAETRFKIKAVLGHTMINYNQGQVLKVKGWCRSPEFNISTAFSDVAIMVLERPVQINEFVQPACLGLNKRPTNSAQCWVVGSGRRTPFDIDLTQVRALPVGKCADPLYRSDQGCFVANRREIPGSVCQGDSGGPTICIDDCGGSPKMVAVSATSTTVVRSCFRDFYQYQTADFYKLRNVIIGLFNDCDYKRAKQTDAYE